MLLEGIVTNGAIVLDQPGLLPEGMRVTINIDITDSNYQSLREFLLKYAGSAAEWASDPA